MLQKNDNSDQGGKLSLTAENLPLYFLNEKDNKIVKVQKNLTTVFYQIKRYDNGEIIHSYGSLPMRPLEEISKELENYVPSTFERFKEVVASYHHKERENAGLMRKHVFKITEALEPIIVKPEWIWQDREGNLTVTFPKHIQKTKIKATFIIY